MKSFLFTLCLALYCGCAFSQTSTSIHVNGTSDKFYPVLISDPGWYNNTPTEISIGRSDIHADGNWKGSLVANFAYHTNNYGNRAEFISASIYTGIVNSLGQLIGGWEDATTQNGNQQMIIWLRGTLTYYINSKSTLTMSVYDGVQNALPFMESGALARTYKTSVDSYVNQYGVSNPGSAYFSGLGKSYFMGNVGIGTSNPTEKLSVNGKIRAHEIKVETANWPDYVFRDDYQLPSLQTTEQHILAKGHLPGIPSASQVTKDGIELGEMNKKLLQKIEELTLYLIDQSKSITELKSQNKDLFAEIEKIKTKP